MDEHGGRVALLPHPGADAVRGDACAAAATPYRRREVKVWLTSILLLFSKVEVVLFFCCALFVLYLCLISCFPVLPVMLFKKTSCFAILSEESPIVLLYAKKAHSAQLCRTDCEHKRSKRHKPKYRFKKRPTGACCSEFC